MINKRVRVVTKPRIFIEWENSEAGYDKNQSYERVDDNTYVNTYNRSFSILRGDSFFDVLEKIYKEENVN